MRPVASGPRRNELGKPHLDAHIVPVERALITRADALEAEAEDMAAKPVPEGAHGSEQATVLRIAKEFRNLAEELHHW